MQLPKKELPAEAVKFNEPNTIEAFLFQAIPYALFSILIFCILSVASYAVHRSARVTDISAIGIIVSLVSIVVHEFLHAFAFGKNADTELFFLPKYLIVFGICTKAVTKRYYVFIMLFPSVILGWIPFLLWFALPYIEFYSNFLLTFSFISIVGSAGDYLKAFNALKQMPKGSIQQSSGFNSYWYLPDVPPSN